MRWAERHLDVLLLAPALAMLSAFTFLPVAGSFWLSLHRVVLGLPKLGEPFVGLDNYTELAESSVFLQAVATTLVFVAVSTALELTLGLGVALCLDGDYRGRGIVRAAVLVPWALPTVAAAQMWRFLFNDRFGPVSYYLLGGSAPLADPVAALGAVVAADVWKTTPFVALLLLAGLQTIPEELLEAARVDGAGPVRRFVGVVLPMLRPALLVALLFRTIDGLRMFDLVFVMTQGGPASATSVLQYLGYKRMFGEGMIGSGAAISTVVFLVAFLVSLAYVRLAGSRLWQETGR
jgi:ABC-type sugar transport system permease subunit